jgi:hypothetical protein
MCCVSATQDTFRTGKPHGTHPLCKNCASAKQVLLWRAFQSKTYFADVGEIISADISFVHDMH